MIVTSKMTSVRIDPAARTARVEAGTAWRQVIAAAAEYGLAPLSGTSPHVGVVGYTLGGGIGLLARKYGFAADSVRWIELVTADGQLRRASPSENSDLFWGLLGGGGNFGVVTALEFSLYPVAKIYGGGLVYPAEFAREGLCFFRQWTRDLPDGMTSAYTIQKYPALPFVPEEIRGKTLVFLRGVFTGDPAEGAALIQPWLDWHAPVQDTFREMPFTEVGSIFQEPENPVVSFGSHETLDDLGDEVSDVIVRYATDSASPLIYCELRHAGGALDRADSSASAIGTRGAQYYLQMGGAGFTPEIRAASDGYIRRFKDALRPFVRGNLFLNFVAGSEMHSRIQDAYPTQTYTRLQALKSRYDPENLFRYSFPLK